MSRHGTKDVVKLNYILPIVVAVLRMTDKS